MIRSYHLTTPIFFLSYRVRNSQLSLRLLLSKRLKFYQNFEGKKIQFFIIIFLVANCSYDSIDFTSLYFVLM